MVCVTDAVGDDCHFYSAHQAQCGNFDDSDFNASSMCCACGGTKHTQIHLSYGVNIPRYS